MRGSRTPVVVASSPVPAWALGPKGSSTVKPVVQASPPSAGNEEPAVKFGRALTDLSRQDPAEAVQFVLENIRAEPQRSDSLIDIFDAWAATGPFEAARYAESLPAGPDRNNALYVVADRWTKANPTSAYIWMKSLPEFDALHLTVFDDASR